MIGGVKFWKRGDINTRARGAGVEWDEQVFKTGIKIRGNGRYSRRGTGLKTEMGVR